jgi:hypothetical protein
MIGNVSLWRSHEDQISDIKVCSRRQGRHPSFLEFQKVNGDGALINGRPDRLSICDR